ncbi:MAG: SDR family oxidoreductase [Candidatus Eremiobacteraeota bacterium]|nr:SDR family oxidoreductase [Candidatus Eremiobacteraeota bacterium]MBC5803791.1 SDR family oxidoreductase [Candidatus Eremiobacteraeota bacterium]MBC5825845.1 SDR family oxidoreductase [Candidatus Eremiobacteraeota bacterium]
MHPIETRTDSSTERKIAVITGASRGLGKNMALHLAERGVDIVGTYREAEAEAEDVVAAVAARGGRATMVRLDLATFADIEAFAANLPAMLQATFGRVTFDYLVNNAGHGNYTMIAETTEADFDRLYAVHLKAPYFLTQKVLSTIVDGGRILNISSGLTRFSTPGSSAYAMMKGGVEVFTRYLARELGPRGISANTIAPGAIETDFGGGRVRRIVAAMTAQGRAGLPDDVGSAVAALLSDGGWITGQRIEVSGGMQV